ncbi:MAG: Na/Pi cotransporter family protein, partial [Deltaproteobacteria bacterium]|nr:Na/Pi cotransporter family protein [Deltaproteobacteria bacterium]
FFLGRRKWIYVGDVLLGFGLVFYGLATMKAGFAPLRGNASFISFLATFRADSLGGIFLCITAGTMVTMILQSSSATVGITMALASQGLLDFQTGVALILGDNIGTTITAEIASIGAGINAHRSARAHTLFNVLGVLNVVLFFPLFIRLVVALTSFFLGLGPPDLLVDGEMPNMCRYIANAHTTFNLVNALFFLLVLPYLVKAAVLLTLHRGRAGEELVDELHQIKYLDTTYIDTPSMALAQARAEVIRMGQAVEIMYDDVIQSLKDRDLKVLLKWRKREDAVDNLQREITSFLVKVVQRPIMPEESREVASLMRMANNLERIGDAIENVAELVRELIEQDLHLSDGGLRDYGDISEEVRRFIRLVVEAIKQEDLEIMPRAQEIENRIDDMREEMRGNYLVRMQSGVCTVDPGLILVDMLTAFEKMGDFCYNIAQAVAGVK